MKYAGGPVRSKVESTKRPEIVVAAQTWNLQSDRERRDEPALASGLAARGTPVRSFAAAFSTAY